MILSSYSNCPGGKRGEKVNQKVGQNWKGEEKEHRRHFLCRLGLKKDNNMYIKQAVLSGDYGFPFALPALVIKMIF